MSNDNIKTLNKITKQLIDTRYGYSKGAEMVEDKSWIQQEFSRRAASREAMVLQFQTKVREMGEEAETDGTVGGIIAEGFTKFSTMFRDDHKAALSLIDDAEEKLAGEIEDSLEDKMLSPEVRGLLSQAHQSAVKGERFADRLEDAA